MFTIFLVASEHVAENEVTPIGIVIQSTPGKLRETTSQQRELRLSLIDLFVCVHFQICD